MDGTHIINLGYITKIIKGRNRYIVYDKNQSTGVKLASLYAV